MVHKAKLSGITLLCTRSRASIPDRELEESTQYHVGTGRPPSTSSDLPMTNKDWRSKAKKMHRIVEQIDHEPLGIVVFKWCLILIGSVMLGKTLNSFVLTGAAHLLTPQKLQIQWFSLESLRV